MFLRLDKFITNDADGQPGSMKMMSTAKVFAPAPGLIARIGEASFNGITPKPVGTKLTPDMFYFTRNIPDLEEGANHLHFYTLNKPGLTRDVVHALGLAPDASLKKVA